VLSDPQAEQLKRHDWPGNVRKLQNLIERAVILSKGGKLHLDSSWCAAGTRHRRPSPSVVRLEIVPDQEWRRHERDNLVAALKRSGGRVYGPDGAAELLGVKPSTLQSRVRSLGVRARDTNSEPC
jgi:transcriptional regulator with GAF, ATPase, and Fis domain